MRHDTGPYTAPAMPEPSDLDRSAIRRQFDRRADDPAAADFLLREVEGRMLERMELIRLAPTRILDAGCGFGQGLTRLAQRWPDARGVGIDLSAARLARAEAANRPVAGGWLAGLLRRLGSGTEAGARNPSGAPQAVPDFIAADTHALPLASQCVDLLWSNLVLHWLDDVPAAIAEWHRVLRPGGLLMFSALGVDTLVELRRAGVDVPALPDMHDIGDALVQAGFADPVMDTERLSITWRDARALMADLRALGGNPRRGRARGLVSPRRLQAELQTLSERLSLRPEAPVRVTFEVIYGHAWRSTRSRRSDGLAPIEFRPSRAARDR